ncbi:MAG: Gfo/Idh/MocA family oxidoreductase [Tepidisphaeraceae bacterium]
MSARRLAIIGTRGHYATLLNELLQMSDVELCAAAHGGSGDTIAPVLAWAAEHGQTVRDFGPSWREMLDQTAPDSLIVCGPLERHAEMTCEAIERGIHVMVEKPIALTFEQLTQIRAACARNPRVHVATMMFSRYTPGFYTAARLVHDGAIGDVRLIEARKSYKLGRRGGHYLRRETYGGTILWVGSHAIDWVAWLSGQRFRSVFASHTTAHNDNHGQLERSALCHFTLDNNCFASVAIDMFRPLTAPTHGDDWARVVGTTGVLEVRPDRVDLILTDTTGSSPISVKSPPRRPLRDFVDHLNGVTQALLDVDGTLHLADACLRALQSADDGRVVRFGTPDMQATLGPAATRDRVGAAR